MSNEIPTGPPPEDPALEPRRLSDQFSSLHFTIGGCLLVLAAGSLMVVWQANENTMIKEDLSQTQSSVQTLSQRLAAGNPEVKSEMSRLRQDSTSLIERLDAMEEALGVRDELIRRLEEKSSEVESQRAVQRARVAVLATQLKASQRRLERLKELQAGWQTRLLSITEGEAGKRIAASSPHLELTTAIIEKELPSADEVLQWQLQLEALAAPIEHAAEDEEAQITITTEHSELLDDLGKQLAQAVTDFEQPSLLLEAVLRETANVEPGELSLTEVIERRRADAERETAERIVAARQAAREEAEQEQAALLARLEQEQVAEETRIKEAEQRARTEGLQAEANRLEQARKRAELEREFQRDLPQVRALLVAFTAPGFTYRQDDTKGPASFSMIKANGTLESSRTGMERLMRMASVKNDRPRGGIPQFLGGDLEWNITNKTPIEQAQRLLTKYGDLMVEKGMLAP